MMIESRFTHLSIANSSSCGVRPTSSSMFQTGLDSRSCTASSGLCVGDRKRCSLEASLKTSSRSAVRPLRRSPSARSLSAATFEKLSPPPSSASSERSSRFPSLFLSLSPLWCLFSRIPFRNVRKKSPGKMLLALQSHGKTVNSSSFIIFIFKETALK